MIVIVLLLILFIHYCSFFVVNSYSFVSRPWEGMPETWGSCVVCFILSMVLLCVFIISVLFGVSGLVPRL